MSRYVNADIAKIYLNPAACEQIKNMPTADVQEVMHGKWIPDDFEYDYYHCSECDFEEHDSPVYLTPYCPNCGAKMDLEVSE